MRESYGGVGLFIIVIFFLAVFSAYLALSVNYSRAFKVKDEIISIIERRKGINSTSISEIQEYLAEVGYRTTGTCEEGYSGYDLTSPGTVASKPVFCVQEHRTNNEYDGNIDSSYYDVEVFFRLEIPIFESIFKIDLKGTTKEIFIPRR